MSSKTVRDDIFSFLTAQAPTEDVVDLSAESSSLEDLLTDYGLTINDPWLGIQFLADEEPVSIQSGNNKGKYRESGSILLHVVEVAKLGVANDILTRAEVLRDLFRGRRINNTIIIEKVSTTTFGAGATLNFDDGYIAGVINIDYIRDFDL